MILTWCLSKGFEIENDIDVSKVAVRGTDRYALFDEARSRSVLAVLITYGLVFNRCS